MGACDLLELSYSQAYFKSVLKIFNKAEILRECDKNACQRQKMYFVKPRSVQPKCSLHYQNKISWASCCNLRTGGHYLLR